MTRKIQSRRPGRIAEPAASTFATTPLSGTGPNALQLPLAGRRLAFAPVYEVAGGADMVDVATHLQGVLRLPARAQPPATFTFLHRGMLQLCSELHHRLKNPQSKLPIPPTRRCKVAGLEASPSAGSILVPRPASTQRAKVGNFGCLAPCSTY